MKKGIVHGSFVCFFCVSLLLLMNVLPGMLAEAKEKTLPIGEMVSRGEVRFEAKENIWKTVESSHFPVLQDVKIKTGKGVALIALESNSQVEVGENSLFSFEGADRLNLFQGRIDFRIPATSEMNLKVRKLTIIRSRSLQAGKESLSAVPRIEEAIGAISIHPNGSVTIKSLQGRLSVLGQDRAVLAALSSKESVTIPSATASGTMVAQAPQDKKAKTGAIIAGGGGELAPLALGGVGAGLGGVIAGGVIASSTSSSPKPPICR